MSFGARSSKQTTPETTVPNCKESCTELGDDVVVVVVGGTRVPGTLEEGPEAMEGFKNETLMIEGELCSPSSCGTTTSPWTARPMPSDSLKGCKQQNRCHGCWRISWMIETRNETFGRSPFVLRICGRYYRSAIARFEMRNQFGNEQPTQ